MKGQELKIKFLHPFHALFHNVDPQFHFWKLESKFAILLSFN